MSAVRNDAEPQFRAMTEADLDTVMEIELGSYAQPWSRRIFSDCLRVGYLCVLMEVDREIQGYTVVSAGAGEAHVLNLCVRRCAQGKGLGRRLLHHVLEAARRLKVEVILLEVRPSNTQALALYSSVGFNEIGIRKDYYPSGNGREDAVLMAMHLEPTL